MDFSGKCVYLGSNSFNSKKNGEVYYLVKLHLPSGDIHDFFVDEKIYSSLELPLYSNVNVKFSMSSYNKSIQVSVISVTKI